MMRTFSSYGPIDKDNHYVEAVDEQNRQKYEAPYQDPVTGVRVEPLFVATG